MLDSYTMQRIMREITLDEIPASPDNSVEAAFRKAVRKDIKMALEDGAIIDWTLEFPEPE